MQRKTQDPERTVRRLMRSDCRGIQGLSRRGEIAEYRPDGATEVTLHLRASMALCKQRHRTRLKVSCSNLPLPVRNLNIGCDSLSSSKSVVATRNLTQSAAPRSFSSLPVRLADA